MKEIKNIPFIKKIWDRYGFNIFLVLAAFGLLLTIIPENKSKVINNTASSFDYISNLEEDLTDIISAIDGVGKVKILITLESGEETVYVTQEKISENESENNQKSTYENEVVLITNGGEKKPLIKQTLQPVVQGVVVVCQGADDIKVVSEITNAVSVALCITTNRVCVIKMQ